MSKHGPCRLSSYLATHATIMQRYIACDFVARDTLAIERYGPSIYLGGQIGCLGGIVVSVAKKIRILGGEDEDDCLVQTELYTYNASISGHGSILRYDNQHPEQLHDGHHDPHHVHFFDWRTSEELAGSPKWIGEAGWPTLGEVIEILRTWHSDHYNQIPFPDSYPTQLESGIRF